MTSVCKNAITSPRKVDFPIEFRKPIWYLMSEVI